MKRFSKALIGAALLLWAHNSFNLYKTYVQQAAYERSEREFWYDEYCKMRDAWFDEVEKRHQREDKGDE